LSNELAFQYVIPELLEQAKQSRVYMGVGPEQNFTYMWALQSKMGFIIDIRRQNMLTILLHKALFEMSADRAPGRTPRSRSANAPAGTFSCCGRAASSRRQAQS